MSANTTCEDLRLSNNNIILRRGINVSPTAIALILGVVPTGCKWRVKISRFVSAITSGADADLQVRVSRDGTAPAADVGDLIATHDSQVAAGTVEEKNPNSGTEILNAGDIVFAIPTSTLTNLSGASIELECEPVQVV